MSRGLYPRIMWSDNARSASARKKKRADRRKRHVRLGNEGSQRRRCQKRLIEILRQRVEVGGVGYAVVIEVGLIPEFSGCAAEVARQRIEIQRIHKPIEIRVAAPDVADEHVGTVN